MTSLKSKLYLKKILSCSKIGPMGYSTQSLAKFHKNGYERIHDLYNFSDTKTIF